jgi:hypothetical protein
LMCLTPYYRPVNNERNEPRIALMGRAIDRGLHNSLLDSSAEYPQYVHLYATYTPFDCIPSLQPGG